MEKIKERQKKLSMVCVCKVESFNPRSSQHSHPGWDRASLCHMLQHVCAVWVPVDCVKETGEENLTASKHVLKSCILFFNKYRLFLTVSWFFFCFSYGVALYFLLPCLHFFF